MAVAGIAGRIAIGQRECSAHTSVGKKTHMLLKENCDWSKHAQIGGLENSLSVVGRISTGQRDCAHQRMRKLTCCCRKNFGWSESV
jgi:hypothetical protein